MLQHLEKKGTSFTCLQRIMEKGFQSKEDGSENIAFNSECVKSMYFKHRIYLVQILYFTCRCARCVGSEGTFLHGQIQQ